MANNHRNAGKSKSKSSRPQLKNTAVSSSTSSRSSSTTTSSSPAGNSSRTMSMESKPTRLEITQHTVAEAAYYLWLRRGGDEISNWLEAERQLRQGTFAR